MKDGDEIFFFTPEEFRQWLSENHSTAKFIWIGYYKKTTGRANMSWDESVDEALCFGWIDGIRKSIDNQSYKIRFTPRKPGSVWSNKNVARLNELIQAGKVDASGKKAFEVIREERNGIYSFEQEPKEFTNVMLDQFRANNAAWNFFQSQPPSYRKTATFWVLSAKQEKTRLARLERLIADSADGLRIKELRRSGA